MSFPNAETELNQPKSRSNMLDIGLISVVLTVLFHFLPADRPYGPAFFIFIIALTVGIASIAMVSKRHVARWSFLFVVPAIFSALASALYASPAIRFLAFVISISSLAFFAYWSSRGDIAFSEVRTFWPFSFFKRTILPFGSLSMFMKNLKGDKRLGGVVLGIVFAIPFLFVFFAAFASADQLFAKSFSSLFGDAEFGIYVYKTIRDVIVGTYFLASGAAMLAQAGVNDKSPESQQGAIFGQTVYVTFLTLLNILFAVFVAFQFAYFFGGEAFLNAHGIRYADYARQGFFQLLFVSGIVFFIAWLMYRQTGMKQRWTKITSLLLIGQTGIIIISAMKRLALYVSEYGLTLSRWWAGFSIMLILMVLLLVFVLALFRTSYGHASKLVFLAIFFVSSAFMLFNSENCIAEYNVAKYLSGEIKNLDVEYLNGLSADAIPAIAHAYTDRTQGVTLPIDTNEFLKARRDTLTRSLDKDLLGSSISTHWALAAIGKVIE